MTKFFQRPKKWPDNLVYTNIIIFRFKSNMIESMLYADNVVKSR